MGHSIRLGHGLASSLLLAACFESVVTSDGEASSDTDEATATSTSPGSTDGSDTTPSTTGPVSDDGLTDSDSTSSGADSSADVTGSTTEDTGDAEDTADTEDTEDDDRFACAEEETCTPPAPAGWSGPSVIHRGDDPPSDCPGEFPLEAFVAHDQLVADDPACGCSCGNASGFSCSTTARENGTSCIALQFAGTWPVPGDGCVSINTNATAMRSDPAILNTTNASCPPQANVNIPSPYFVTTVKGCNPPRTPTRCEDAGLCLPAAMEPYGEMCVYTEGDVACPAGPYTERSVAYTSIEDTRECSDCTCGTPTGTCGGLVRYVSACSGDFIGLYATTAPGACTTMNTSPSAVSYAPEPQVSCMPSGGQAQGEANPAAPITVCCLP
jgi:hypothetical protein